MNFSVESRNNSFILEILVMKTLYHHFSTLLIPALIVYCKHLPKSVRHDLVRLRHEVEEESLSVTPLSGVAVIYRGASLCECT